VPLPIDIIFVLDALMRIIKRSTTLSMAFNISTSYVENNTMSSTYNNKRISCSVRSPFTLHSHNILPSPW
jgi:hypothetical protein